jgi:DNA primase
MLTADQSRVLSILNIALKEQGYRKGYQVKYHCFKCNHRKQKLEICIQEDNCVGHCWVCNFSGSIVKILKECGAPQEYIQEVSKICKIKSYNGQDNTEDDKPRLTLPTEFKPLWIPNKDFEYKHALLYCKRRGMTAQDIIKYGLGYCTEGHFKGRIIIPSYDENCQLNFFSGRSWYEDSTMKYLNPDCSRDVIGFDLFINWNTYKSINLVEGQFDAISIKRNTIPLFGKQLSNRLMHKIHQRGIKRVNVLLDNDAKKDIIQISDRLMNEGIDVGVHIFKEKDPSEIGFNKMCEIIRDIKPCTFSDIMRLKIG